MTGPALRARERELWEGRDARRCVSTEHGPGVGTTWILFGDQTVESW